VEESVRYPNAVFRFILNTSLLFQISLTVVSVLMSLCLVFFAPWLNHNPMLFIVPIILAAWMFSWFGLFLCLCVLLSFAWINYYFIFGAILPSAAGIVNVVVNGCLFIFIGLFVSSLRADVLLSDSLYTTLAEEYQEQLSLADIQDQFLQKVNHELRTPLTAIYGYLELLLEYGNQLENEMRTAFLQHAMQGCDELQLLVNNVLDTMSKEKERQTLFVEPIPVRDILFEVLERFDPKTLQEHPIHVDIPDYVVVLANAQYLRQILRNLLSNAFKYVPMGTPIIVSAALFGMVIHPLHASPEICVKVKDFGAGISTEEIPLLFKQFVRLRREQASRVAGSGLGLFISKQFVEAMGGRIWVESDGIPGEGSCFCFTIPCVTRPHVNFKTTHNDFVKFSAPLFIE
jgi:signal transduction histidine kinase